MCLESPLILCSRSRPRTVYVFQLALMCDEKCIIRNVLTSIEECVPHDLGNFAVTFASTAELVVEWRSVEIDANPKEKESRVSKFLTFYAALFLYIHKCTLGLIYMPQVCASYKAALSTHRIVCHVYCYENVIFEYCQ